MSDTSLVFNSVYRDRGVNAGLARTSIAVRAAQVAATAGTVALGAALAGTAAHAIALGHSIVLATQSIAILPAMLTGAIAMLTAGIVVTRGLGDAWKAMGKAASGGGSSAADIAHRVDLATRGVRNATQALADAQRDAHSAQEALTRAREDASERLEDLSRSLTGARLDERGAMLAVEEARRRMAQARGSGDSLEIRKAQLAYEQAGHTLEEVRDRVSDLAKEQAEANEKGVEGSDIVQTAVQRQEQAQRSLTAATERLADAQRELAQAGKSSGGAADKAREALAALAPSARELLVTMRELGPAWTAAGKAAQQATFAGVASDVRLLSAVYLPQMTSWLRRMGEAFNVTIRDMMGLATTRKFAADMSISLGNIADMTRRIGQSMTPFLSGFMHFTTVGSTLLPGIADTVHRTATRFEAWAAAARESGRMQEWMTTGLSTLKQFWQLTKNLVMSVVALFKAGENAGTLEGLVAGTAAMRAWLESAEGSEKVGEVLAFLRNILADLAAIVPAFANNSGVLINTMSVFGVVVGFVADHLDTFAALLPYILSLFVIWKTAQVAVNIVTFNGLLIRGIEIVTTWRSIVAMRAHTAALVTNTTMQGRSTVATGLGTFATTAGDVATKRSVVSMVAARVAMVAGAIATGVITAAQWAWNAAMYANPIGLIILAIVALTAAWIFLIIHIKDVGAWTIKIFTGIWDKLKQFGAWVADDFAPKLLHWLTWPHRKALELIMDAWHRIQMGATFAKDWIVDKFTALVGFITSLPGRMRAAAANLFDGIKDSFRNAINWIIARWNNFQLTLGGGNVMGMAIPSVTLRTPDLPFLDVGGDITRTGLAVVHQGERVFPAAQAEPLRQGGGRDVRVIFGSDGSTFGDFILEAVREAVRKRGGDFDGVVFET